MTEAEWLACVSPMPMLELVIGRVSDRKLRQFACACCRQPSISRLLRRQDSQAIRLCYIEEVVSGQDVGGPWHVLKNHGGLAGDVFAQMLGRNLRGDSETAAFRPDKDSDGFPLVKVGLRSR